MKSNILFLFFSLFLLYNCNKEEVVVPPSEINCTNCLNFNELELGQQSKYLNFVGESRIEDNPSFDYTDDTLVVKVIGVNGGFFLIEEHFAENPDSSWNYEISLQADKVVFRFPEWPVDPNYTLNSSMLLQQYSHLFELPMTIVDGKIGDMNGWEVVFDSSCNTAPCYGTIENYEQFGFSFPKLNVFHDYGPMAFDGAGIFFFYHNDFGIVRSVSVGSWIPKGWGWDLILD